MPELPKLEVVCEVLNRRVLGQTIVSAEVIPPGGPIGVRDLTGEGFGTALASARFDTISRRGKFLLFRLATTDDGAVPGRQSQTGRPAATVRAEGQEGRPGPRRAASIGRLGPALCGSEEDGPGVRDAPAARAFTDC